MHATLAQDIACQEELTFDYNFERYGDKPMRCYCGSKTCRKFIGGVQDTYHESMTLVGGAASSWEQYTWEQYSWDMGAVLRMLWG